MDWHLSTQIVFLRLCGADYYWKLVTGHMSRCEDGPVAIDTRLGWVLSGPVPRMKPKSTTLHVATTASETDTLNETYSWELESLGVKQPGQSVLTDFEKVKFKNARYLVSLPWKDRHPPSSDNYELALNAYEAYSIISDNSLHFRRSMIQSFMSK